MNQSIVYLFVATATLLAMLSVPISGSNEAMPFSHVQGNLRRMHAPPTPPMTFMPGYNTGYYPFHLSHYYPETPGAGAMTIPAASVPMPQAQPEPEPKPAPAPEAAPAQPKQPAQPRLDPARRFFGRRRLSPKLSTVMASIGGASASLHQGQPGVATATAGTFAANGPVHESAFFARDAQSLQRHEHGREDDDHYFQSQAESKSSEKNEHEAYNNEDEDIMQDGNMYRKKKTSTNYVKSVNKTKNKNGTGVLAKDQHHASYNKDRHHMTDNISQQQIRNANGAMAQFNSATSSNFDDEDEAYYNNGGLHAAPRFASPYNLYPIASAYSNGGMSAAHVGAAPIAAQAGK